MMTGQQMYDETFFENLRILIVDDSKAIQKVLMKMLGQLHIQTIRTAMDGGEALAIIKEGFTPDIILADFEMPVLDGVEFTRIIRTAKDVSIHQVPIIMITSHNDDAHFSMARDAGVSDFLTKPFSLEHLTHHMKAVVRQPRSFIEGTFFTGPDRRRRAKPGTDRDERRNDG